VLRQDLQRHAPLERDLLGQVHHTHAAATELLDDAKVTQQRPVLEWAGIAELLVHVVVQLEQPRELRARLLGLEPRAKGLGIGAFVFLLLVEVFENERGYRVEL
jgi:hypothetical protein